MQQIHKKNRIQHNNNQRALLYTPRWMRAETICNFEDSDDPDYMEWQEEHRCLV